MRCVLIDTDLNAPSDDLLALVAVLLARPRLEIAAILATSGNSWASETCANVARLLRLAGRAEIPLFLGADLPDAPHSRDAALQALRAGEIDFAGVYAKSEVPVLSAADRYIVDSTPTVARDVTRLADIISVGPIDVLALAPLTNLARLCALPWFRRAVRSQTVMALWSGQTKARAAEFNQWFDPAALEAVAGCGIPTLFVPSDVAGGAELVDDSFGRSLVPSLGPLRREFLAALLRYRARCGERPALPDLIAALVFLAPDVVRTTVPVRLAAQSRVTPDESTCVQVATHIDVALARRVLFDGLRSDDYGADPGPFSDSTSYRFCRERIAARQFVALSMEEDEAKMTTEHSLDMPEKCLATFAACLPLLLEAKLAGEIWPPATEIDAWLASGQDRTQGPPPFVALDFEREMLDRFLRVDAIAIASQHGGVPCAFACIADIDETRRERLHDQFGVHIPHGSVITEFGLVGATARGHRWFERMNRALIAWALRSLRPEDACVYGVVLETQTASLKSCLRLGYSKLAERWIRYENGTVRRADLLMRPLRA